MLLFEQAGINTDTNLAKKLWRVARILGERSPFDDYILNHSVVQMDFILDMYSKDRPEELKYTKAGEVEDNLKPMLYKIWADVFTGKTQIEFMMSPVAFFKKYYNREM